MVLQKYKKKFVAYLNKDNLDHMQGSINPLDYHSSYLAFARLFSVVDYEKLPMWMYISPICTAISAISAIIVFSISLVEYVRLFKVNLITECGTYLLVVMYKFLIVWTIFREKKHYHTCLQALRDDFNYICTKEQKYRERFFENQRLTFKVSVLVAIFLGIVGSGVAVCACIPLAINIQNQEVGAERPLPFPFWLFDYNLHASPVYEILVVTSIFFTFFHTYVYIFWIQTQIIWVREIMCRADIIIWNIQELLVDVSPAKNKEEKEYYAALIKHRMRGIIEMHVNMFKLMEKHAAVFKKCLVFEQIITPPIICMTTYCFAEKYDAGEVQFILLLLCIAVIVVAFIPCYLCSHLLEKVQSVSDACWDVPFWNAGLVIRPYLVLIMQRSMRPLPLTVAGFSDTSLQTFSKMMTRAYSCFNMLRQADFNFN